MLYFYNPHNKAIILAVSTRDDRTIVLYTLNPWRHALPVLRVIGPAQQAGFRVIPGNRMETVSPRLVSAASLVVIQRDFPRLNKAYLEIRERAQAAGTPVIFDLDDLLLGLPPNHIDQKNQYYADAYLPVMQAMLDADFVTASSAPLCDYLRTYNPKTSLLPNYLNDHLWSIRQPRSTAHRDAPIVIGYMGSNTHDHDLQLISPALEEILQRYKTRVALKLWSLKPPRSLGRLSNVEWIPNTIYDYAAYASYIVTQVCDIAIAPLEDNLFNLCKSPLKYLEYSALGIPGVYSEMAPYRDVIQHGENGMLARSQQEWVNHLLLLIEEPHLRQEMAKQAQATIVEHWLLSNNTACLQTFYQEMIPTRSPKQNLAYPTQVIEQTLIKLRMALTPPGSLRERVVWAPIRTAQIINTEGFPGMARRLRDSLKHSKNSAPEPLLLQQSSQTGAGGNFPRRRTSMPSLAETGFGNTYSQNEPLIFDTSRQTVQISRSSIIILTHNNLNYTRLCLDSIFDHTSGMDFEVIIVDNGSSDGTQDYLASLAAAHKKQPKLPVLKVIQNQENQGFARGNNQGAAAADGDILVFLNNDTIVTPGWLPGLVKYLRFPEIGMVGPVTNSSGNESRIETEYRNLEEMQTFARAYTQQHDGEAFEIGMLAFLCVGIRRSVYQEIGALDERFGLGMFEDDDYAIRVRKNNYHIICAQDVFIHHWGSASFSRLPSKDFYRIFNKNHKKFEEKWGDQWIK